MRIRSAVALVGLTISFALPTSAQEQSAVDPETRQEIEAVGKQYAEAYNKHDAAAVAALFTQDAVRIGDIPANLVVGREAIEKDFAEQEFAAGFKPIDAGKLVQIYAIEDRIAAISEWSAGSWHGHAVAIYVRDAETDTWKIRMEFVTATQMPRYASEKPRYWPPQRRCSSAFTWRIDLSFRACRRRISRLFLPAATKWMLLFADTFTKTFCTAL